ncbi:MAG: HAD-IC family P-type ATPase [Polyangiaceae bacterium]
MDPLRAGHVAVLEGRFRYFCRAECKQSFLRAEGRPLEEDVATQRPPDVEAFLAEQAEQTEARRPNGTHHNGTNGHSSHPRPTLPSAPRATAPSLPSVPPVASLPPVSPAPAPVPSARFEREEPVESAPRSRTTLLTGEIPSPSPSRRTTPRLERQADRALPVLDAVGIIAGGLVPALGLLGASAEVARLPLVLVAGAAMATRLLLGRRDAADAHALVVLAPTLGAVAATCWASVTHDTHAAAIAVMAGLTCAVALASEMLVDRVRVRIVAARERIERALDARARAVHGEDAVEMPACEVRPGEQVLVEAGELVGVDATVTAGEARVVPWLDAGVDVVKREGDPIVAGARVVSSRLRMMTTWSGRERAWVKLLATPALRVDVAAPTARALRLTIERGSPVAALLVGIAAFSANATPVQILAAMCAGATAFGARAVASLVALYFARAQLEALSRGITYKDARAFERAASASVAVFSARGTLLLGEPEIVAIEPIGTGDVERVLSLAAGAETGSSHPFAAAILRAARARGVAADHVRNATAHAGLGVTALASTGERLVVGGRAIMLEEKIGVAVTDARASELEALGRSVLLVALGDRLLGLIALQDGLRPGARAAVQKLLDVRVEPVLMSGEARETCETIGRSLDIEHVRPEVLPADRGAEVRALSESGGVVAVIGHAVGDDGALGAADVAVAMSAAGSTPGEWAVALASDDVRDAALALAIPHASRDRARAAIALGATPGVVALLAIGFGIAPLAVAPLAALVGAIAVAVQGREIQPGQGAR